MIKFFLVIFATALTFYLLRDKMRSSPNEHPSTQNQAILAFFLLVIYIGIFFWLDITSIIFSQKGGGATENIKINTKDFNIERNIINSIREEVDTGSPPF